jgi:hypothetical protein
MSYRKCKPFSFLSLPVKLNITVMYNWNLKVHRKCRGYCIILYCGIMKGRNVHHCHQKQDVKSGLFTIFLNSKGKVKVPLCTPRGHYIWGPNKQLDLTLRSLVTDRIGSTECGHDQHHRNFITIKRFCHRI